MPTLTLKVSEVAETESPDQYLLILEQISPSEAMKPDRLVSCHASSLLESAKCLVGTFWPFLGSTPPQKDADAARDHSTVFSPKSSKRPVAGTVLPMATLCKQRLPGWAAGAARAAGQGQPLAAAASASPAVMGPHFPSRDYGTE